MTSAIDRSKCRVDSEQECRRLRIRSPVQDIGGFRIQSRIVGDGKEILGGYVHAPARSQGITDLEVFEAKIRRIFHKNARFLAAVVIVDFAIAIQVLESDVARLLWRIHRSE